MGRRRLTDIQVEPNPSNQKPEDQPLDETVSLKFEEATDAVEPEKPNRIKKALSNVFISTDEPEETKKPRRRVSKFFTKNIGLVVGCMLFAINMLVPEEYKEVFYVNDKAFQYLPTEDQLTDIMSPLARIADRHTHIADVHPDVMDVLASGQACVAYGMELRATMLLKAHLERKEREAKQNDKMTEWRNRINGISE